ncbi:magnesium/cobalt transporter CorA [Methanochimaera problematica]|uniref:magnesium/cobalt transporter CorA n=1 Tax=Methanochimaera problematica TaxID=2609417 RepID=UPI0029394CD8|nr:magnesium/cobalt transporter CorA [Methanoplanus sp. FWC-SCC4]
MKSHSIKESSKAGLPPGTLIHISQNLPAGTLVNRIEYNEKYFKKTENISVDEITYPRPNGIKEWIQIKGLADISQIEKIGTILSVHSLTLEDILNTYLRPKYEHFDDYIYLSLKYLFIRDSEIVEEQISLLVKENLMVSFQENNDDLFGIIEKRLKENIAGRIRSYGTDYLLYAVIDFIVDNYFIVFEYLGEKIDEIEDILIEDPSGDVLDSIYSLKRDLIQLRKIIWPVRDLISGITRNNSAIIKEGTIVFFNDIMDHIISIIDTLETYRDMVSGMREIYLSGISNRMNEVMKVLTIIATIFIPLTFIAGIYGMNFKNMPELEWEMGYFAVLFVMIILGISMFVYFKNKKWM